MPRLSIKGTVIGAHGLPVPDAVVTIWDQDIGGNGNDRLLRTTTGSDGVFSGRSRDWRDTNTTRVPNPLASMPGQPNALETRVPDAMLLTFDIQQGPGRRHSGPFIHLGPNASVPIQVPWSSERSLSSNQRRLVQLVTLRKQGEPRLGSLYGAVEFGATTVVQGLLANSYRNFDLLEGPAATLDGLCAALDSATSAQDTHAVDVIVNPHGSNDKLWFHDGPQPMSAVAIAVKAALSTAQRQKLRAVISTACYGRSHLDEWLDMGFAAALGSEGIYADSLLSWAPIVNAWENELTFAQVVAAGNNADPLRTQDSSVSAYYRAMGNTRYAADVNSHRTASGDTSIRITTPPS